MLRRWQKNSKKRPRRRSLKTRFGDFARDVLNINIDKHSEEEIPSKVDYKILSSCLDLSYKNFKTKWMRLILRKGQSLVNMRGRIGCDL